jgi:hypothetical protein
MPETAVPGKPKRHYNIDPVVAHERAITANRVRNSPDTYIRQLERAELTDQQKRRIARLVLPFLDEPAETGDGNAH